MKITVPIFQETEIDDFIPKVIEFGETAKKLKNHYPSVWKALSNHYGLQYLQEPISDELFKRKIEIMILQDEERRKN